MYRLIVAGTARILVGPGLLIALPWTSPPSYALLLIAGFVSGSAVGAVIRGGLTAVIPAPVRRA